MTKRNTAYQDVNFRKVYGHRTDEYGRPIPVLIYSYEGKSKIYDIVLRPESNKYVCRINHRLCSITQSHREIDKFFNLKLEGI